MHGTHVDKLGITLGSIPRTESRLPTWSLKSIMWGNSPNGDTFKGKFIISPLKKPPKFLMWSLVCFLLMTYLQQFYSIPGLPILLFRGVLLPNIAFPILFWTKLWWYNPPDPGSRQILYVGDWKYQSMESSSPHHWYPLSLPPWILFWEWIGW